MIKEINLSNLLTIVINTKNRPRLLNASLNFMNNSNLNAQIIIIDASQDEIWKINEKSIKSLLFKEQSLHLKPRDGRQFPSILEGLSKVKTPYTIVCGDDDFFMVDGLKSCVYFLEKNPKFSACIGKIMQFRGVWDENFQKWTFKTFRDLTPTQIDSDNICTRLCNFADNIETSSYAVHRSEIIKDAYFGSRDSGFADDSSLPELALNSYILVKGALGVIDTFFHFWFNPQNKRTGQNTTLYSGNNSLNWFDKMLSKKYVSNIYAYLDFMMKHIPTKNESESIKTRSVVQSVWGKFYFNVSLRRIEEVIESNTEGRWQKKIIIRISNYLTRNNLLKSITELHKFFRSGVRFGYIRFSIHKHNSDFRAFQKFITKSMTDKSLVPKKIKCQY